MEVMKHLLNFNANNEALDVDGFNPLHFAIKNGHNSCLTLLLDGGSDVNVTMLGDVSPLHFAVEKENVSAVSQLIQYGAKVNSQDCNGQTALHRAVFMYTEENKIKCVKIVEILLEKTVKEALNTRENNGKSALDLAIELKSNDITRMIAKKSCPNLNISHSTYPLKYFF